MAISIIANPIYPELASLPETMCRVCGGDVAMIDDFRGALCLDHVMPFLRFCQACGRRSVIIVGNETYCELHCPEQAAVAVEG